MNLLLGSFSLGHERRFFVFSAAIWNTLHVGVKFSKAIKANCSSPQERKPYQLYGQYQFCSHFHSSACFTEVLELVSGTDNCRQLISLFEEFPVHMPFLCLFPRDGLFEQQKASLQCSLYKSAVRLHQSADPPNPKKPFEPLRRREVESTPF